MTGLMWEGKEASGLRAGSNTYTNYQVGYMGTQAQMDAATNTYGYVAAVNATALCGHTDWRLPTADELQTIVDFGRTSPNINTAWFPNTGAAYYWSSSPLVESTTGGNTPNAWYVHFGYADFFEGHYGRAGVLYVRLVRGGQ